MASACVDVLSFLWLVTLIWMQLLLKPMDSVVLTFKLFYLMHSLHRFMSFWKVRMVINLEECQLSAMHFWSLLLQRQGHQFQKLKKGDFMTSIISSLIQRNLSLQRYLFSTQPHAYIEFSFLWVSWGQPLHMVVVIYHSWCIYALQDRLLYSWASPCDWIHPRNETIWVCQFSILVVDHFLFYIPFSSHDLDGYFL